MTERPPYLPAELQAAADLVEALREQLDGDDDQQLLRDMIEGSTALPEAIRAAMERLEYLEDDVAAANERIKQLTGRKASREAQVERLRLLLLRTLERVPAMAPFREPGRYTLSVSRKPQKISVDCEPEDLPQQYLRVTIAPKLAELKEALQAGDEIDGVSLVDGGNSLSIRRG